MLHNLGLEQAFGRAAAMLLMISQPPRYNFAF
jgi:hypothetical protein